MNSGTLTTILYVSSEIENENTLLQKINRENNLDLNSENQKDGTTLQWIPIQEPVTEECFAEQMNAYKPEECLLITATDQSIAYAKKWNIAMIGYLNPDRLGQSLTGTDLIAEGFEEIDDAYLTRIWQRHHRIPWTIFTTERCLVRELCMDDLNALFELYAQPGMTDFMEELYPWEEEVAYERAYIENMYRFYEYGMWLVFDKVTGELIGRAGLEHRPYPEENTNEQEQELLETSEKIQRRDALEQNEYMEQGSSWDSVPTESEHLELEMGYAIAPSRWHQGYATEVCTGIIAYAKEHLDYKRINCLIQRDNQKSIALMNKLGFQFMEETELTGERMLRYVLNI